MVEDFLYRGIVDALHIRFSYALTTKLVNDAVLMHNCDPVSAHLFGRALTVGVLTCPLLKDDQRATYRWNYAGAVNSIVVDNGADSDVRGFISPTNLSQFAESTDQMFGETCQVTVMRSSKKQIISSGTIQSIFCDPVEDLVHYFSLSDQVESAATVMIGFDANPKEPVVLCHGLLVQALPGCDLELFDRVREHMAEPDARKLLRHEPDFDNYFETVIRSAVEEEDVAGNGIQVWGCPKPEFRCDCSPERMMAAVTALPEEDRRDVLAKQEDLTITCQFCNTSHILPFEEIRKEFG